MLKQTTMVLGAGGPWGVAWMTGVLTGLEEQGIDVRNTGAVIGTSAGAILGARLGASATTQSLFEHESSMEVQAQQLSQFGRLAPPRPPEGSGSNPPSMLSVLGRDWDDREERIRAICDLATNAKTVPWEKFQPIAVPDSATALAWPATPLIITAVDVQSHTLHSFDANSGVKLMLAVMASCAVPGVFPPVPIGGRRYIDGGSWGSGDNAHLATGAGSVLVISPLAAQRTRRIAGVVVLEEDLKRLRDAGARVHLIVADTASLAARGLGWPVPSATALADTARAGREQGLRQAAALRRDLG